MKRRVVIVIICIVLAAIFGGSIYVLSGKSALGKMVSPQSVTEQKQSAQPTVVPELTWDDPAGFTIRYSGELNINNHEEDPDNYAHLELTNPIHPGNIIVWVKDTTAADVTAWVQTDKGYQDANKINTTLGGQPAKKIILTGTVKKTVTGAIYDGLLFMIEGNLSDSAYWTVQYQRISDSFQFKPLENPPPDYSGSGEADSGYDEEETIQ